MKTKKEHLHLVLILFAYVVLIGVAWISFYPTLDTRTLDKRNITHENIGHLIIEEAGSCRELAFDNQTGQWQDSSSGQCKKIANGDTENEGGGGSRFEQIKKGFLGK